MKTLYLIDGYAQFFRAFHAIRTPMSSPVTREPTTPVREPGSRSPASFAMSGVITWRRPAMLVAAQSLRSTTLPDFAAACSAKLHCVGRAARPASEFEPIEITPEAVRMVWSMRVRHTDRRPVSAEPVPPAVPVTLTRAAHGLARIHWLTGDDIDEQAWDAFFSFYMETGSRKWGRPYLTREFYSLVGEKMRDRILLVMAKRNGRWIAGAINFIGSDTLFGRHWGAIEHHPFLHFELCYYQAIQYAIEHKLARVEAGAQGEHKISRGYLPTTTYSAHYIVDPALRRAIEDFLKRERAYVTAAHAELAEAAPFRKGG